MNKELKQKLKRIFNIINDIEEEVIIGLEFDQFITYDINRLLAKLIPIEADIKRIKERLTEYLEEHPF
jgi:hypothetical protein